MDEIRKFAEFAALMLVILGIALSGICWWQALRRLAAGRPLLPMQPRREVPWGLLDVLLTFLLLMAGRVLSRSLLNQFWAIVATAKIEDLSPDGRVAVILAGVMADIVVMAAMLATIVLRLRGNATDIGWNGGQIRNDVKLGVVAFVMLAVPVLGIQWALVDSLRQFLPTEHPLYPTEHPLIQLVRENPEAKFFVVSGISAILVAPFVEEYLFRVLLQGWIERFAAVRANPVRLLIGGREKTEREATEIPANAETNDNAAAKLIDANPYTSPAETADGPSDKQREYDNDAQSPRPIPVAIVASAFLFAILHGWPDCVALFVFAVGLGYLYQRTHRVLPCIVVHLMLNALSLLMLLLNVYLDIE